MFKKIAPDKWKHFYVGIVMGAVLQGISWYLFPLAPLTATLAALGVVIAISYGFELFSLITGMGHYDVMDAVASVIGGVLGMGAAIALLLLW
ncbi:hypothetical protein KTO58_19095 [Chitinophaga pendula]|uniref:hypothetical protein n=1 Tax=Chitinophaga TaxID=79328 RepID=UPI0012FD3338|nr:MULTISPECIES: hypothetical protein [Chitinophaga]UCJ05782.1 hypothetical protein KTO58_19095 [Chitinophaga pendula]